MKKVALDMLVLDEWTGLEVVRFGLRGGWDYAHS